MNMNEDLNGIEALSYEQRKFAPSSEFVANALVSNESMYYEASADHEKFWDRQARELLDWNEPWTQVCEWDLPYSEWFIGGKLNVSYNCLDRHVLAGQGSKVAFIWEGEPGDTRVITYAELLDEVQKFEEEFISFIEDTKPEIINLFKKTGGYDDEWEKNIKEAFESFKMQNPDLF